MSIPFLPIHPHPHPQRLMSKTYRRRLRRQQAGVQAPQGGPDFVSPEDQFRMSLDRSQGLLPSSHRQTLLKPQKRALAGSFFLAAALAGITALLTCSAQSPGEQRSAL